MTLSNPGGLWLLTAAIPLIGLYFYRVRPRRVRVPNLSLWLEMVAEERRWGGTRLREVVSLLLLLSAIGSLALALAGAEIPALAHAPQTYHVLLDTSSSMEAAEPDGRTRAAAAEAFVAQLRERLYYNDTLNLMPSPGEHFAPFVESVAADPPDGTILIVSDRSEAGPEVAGARWVDVASKRPNVGFTRAVLGRAPEERWYTARVRVRNFGDAQASVRLDCRLNGKARRTESLTLAPGQERAASWTFDGAVEGGELAIVLSPPDAYGLDDVVRTRLPPARPVPVAVFHAGRINPFLMETLEILKEADEIDGALSFIEPAERFESLRLPRSMVRIFDGGTLNAPLPPGRYLLIGTRGRGMPLETGPELRDPPVVSWNADSPVNRFLEFSSLHVRSARPIVANGSTETLVEVENAIIGCTQRDADRALIYLSFRLEDSDFGLLPSFPIFIRNALRWLSDPPPPPVAFDPIESDILPKADGEPAEAVLPERPVGWRNVPHAVLFALLAAILLAGELLLRRIGY